MKITAILLLSFIIFWGQSCSTKSSKVDPSPVANFDYSIDKSGKVTFTNKSLYANDYYWDFGDSLGVSTSQNPIYSFQFPFKYEVILRVKNSTGESIVKKEINVDFMPSINLSCNENQIGLEYENYKICEWKEYIEWQKIDTKNKIIDSYVRFKEKDFVLELAIMTKYNLGKSDSLTIRKFIKNTYITESPSSNTVVQNSTDYFYKPLKAWIKVENDDNNTVSGYFAFVCFFEKSTIRKVTFVDNLFKSDETSKKYEKDIKKVLVKGSFKKIKNRW